MSREELYETLQINVIRKNDIVGVDLDLLVLFETIMRERSITRAADVLGMNQPTASQSLRRLREALGDQLFVRSGQGVAPTARGAELIEPIEKILSLMRNDVLARNEFSPNTSERHFVINMSDIGELVFAPPILHRLRKEERRMSLEAATRPPQELLDAMLGGQVDLALGNYPELTARSVYSQLLGEHPIVCIVRKGHPILEGGVSVESYSMAQHAGLLGEGHAQRRIEKSIMDLGISRQVTYRSRNFASIPFVVQATDLVATVPKMLAVAYVPLLNLQAFPLPFDIEPIQVRQYWTERQHNDPGQLWLRRVVAELFQKKDPSSEIELW